MILYGDAVLLRPLEPADLEALHQQKNDLEIANMLVGFSSGYTMADLRDWLEHHRKRQDEVLWAIVDRESQRCLGHVGLYQIDLRARVAEFGIIVGDKSSWNRGIGRTSTRLAVEFAFRELNLNRVQLRVLATNERAIRLYGSMRFREEGRLREAQFKDGRYVDVIVMGVLRSEYPGDAGA